MALKKNGSYFKSLICVMLYYTAMAGLYNSVLLVSGNGLQVLHRAAPATMPGSSDCFLFTTGETDT